MNALTQSVEPPLTLLPAQQSSTVLDKADTVIDGYPGSIPSQKGNPQDNRL